MISLDPIHHRVTVGSRRVELQPLSYTLFAKLLEHQNDIVAASRLTDEVWGDVVVAPDTLKQRVFLLRKALEEAGVEECQVQSVRGQGYRLVVPEAGRKNRSPVKDSRWLWVASAAAIVLMFVAVLRWPFESELPANNRVVFWKSATGTSFNADTGAWDQEWVTRLSSSDGISYLESGRDTEQTLSEQARQVRAALISRWLVFESDGRPQIRMQILEPKTATVLRGDLVAVGDESAKAALYESQLAALERMLSSGILPLSRDALIDTGHLAWSQLRELASTKD